MKLIFLNLIIIFSLLHIGCSTLKESIAVGVLSGAAAGGMAGNRLNDSEKEKATVTGALIGGTIGGIASYLIHNQIEKRDRTTRKELLFNLENNGLNKSSSPSGKYPGLTSPQVEETWVEPHIEENKYIEGHRVYIITEPTRWREEQYSRFRSIPKKESAKKEKE